MDTYRIELLKIGIAVFFGMVCRNVVTGIHRGFVAPFTASIAGIIIMYTVTDRTIAGKFSP